MNVTLQIILGCITAAGSLATVITLIILIYNQKGTQKQINYLSQITETFANNVELSKVALGEKIIPVTEYSFFNRVDETISFTIRNISGCNIKINNIHSYNFTITERLVFDDILPVEIPQGMDHSFSLKLETPLKHPYDWSIYLFIAIENPAKEHYVSHILLKKDQQIFDYGLTYKGKNKPCFI